MPEGQHPSVLRFTRAKHTYLFPRPPFHFDGTFYKPSHFPNRLSHWRSGHFYQTLWIGRKLIGIRLSNVSRPREPRIRLSLFHEMPPDDAEIEYAVRELAYRYDLAADLTDFLKLTNEDNRFAPIFKRWRGMRATTQYSLYELLVVGLVLQNTTVHRSVQMLDALVSSFGQTVHFGDVTLQALWRPTGLDTVEEEELRRLKIGYRAKPLKRFSAQFAATDLDESSLRTLDDETLRRELLRIYGVGPETVRILLTEAFHRHDTFHHVAPWQRKIYSRLFYKKPLVPAPVILDDMNRAYGRWASLAAHYIWEDIFWRRRHGHVPWLEKEIRL